MTFYSLVDYKAMGEVKSIVASLDSWSVSSTLIKEDILIRQQYNKDIRQICNKNRQV